MERHQATIMNIRSGPELEHHTIYETNVRPAQSPQYNLKKKLLVPKNKPQ